MCVCVYTHMSDLFGTQTYPFSIILDNFSILLDKHHGIVSLWFPVTCDMVGSIDPCTRLPEFESQLCGSLAM